MDNFSAKALASMDVAVALRSPTFLIALISAGALYIAFVLQSWRKEAPVSFNVPLPCEIRPNWPGHTVQEHTPEDERRVLEAQARGQWSEKLIMSYCPADGRVLGNGIRPETPAGINRAVQAAKEAQVEWAKSSFAERRKVLKTLLKHVLPSHGSVPTKLSISLFLCLGYMADLMIGLLTLFSLVVLASDL